MTRSARWLIGLVILLVLAVGCEGLTDMGKSAPEDEASDDDSSSRSKKKKKRKKKKSKKKKKKKPDDDADADDDDDDDDAPKPTPSPQTGIAECDSVVNLMECMRDNVPGTAKTSMQQSIDQLKDSIKQLPAATAKDMCAQMGQSMAESAKQFNCKATGPSPSPSPTPSPDSEPKTAQPSSTEWATVTQEVLVVGSSALNCDSKKLREWLRVYCRGRNKTGGTLTSVRITEGGSTWGASAVLNAGAGEIVMRHVSGTHVEAEVAWTDGKRKLVIDWPKGASEPTSKGKFTSAD